MPCASLGLSIGLDLSLDLQNAVCKESAMSMPVGAVLSSTASFQG